MAKGAHRSMMRDQKRLPPAAIEADFERRLRPSLTYCSEVGNIYSGSVMLAACGAIEALTTQRAPGGPPPRLGVFSYGSGCCSEFYSGLVMDRADAALAAARIPQAIAARHALSMPDYERLLGLNRKAMFGVQEMVADPEEIGPLYSDAMAGSGMLVLRRIERFHRQYDWA
jgi:polyketide biosynthesis 3-hydroxy-3-methylglutaryl-CoA synthase-like enzyme PksG